jgi:excisionase family DNA binding protein
MVTTKSVAVYCRISKDPTRLEVGVDRQRGRATSTMALTWEGEEGEVRLGDKPCRSVAMSSVRTSRARASEHFRDMGSKRKRPEERMKKLLLTVEEAAKAIGIGRTKMFELISTGAIKSVRIGASRRVPSAAITEYVEHLGTVAEAPRLEMLGSRGQREA